MFNVLFNQILFNGRPGERYESQASLALAGQSQIQANTKWLALSIEGISLLSSETPLRKRYQDAELSLTVASRMRFLVPASMLIPLALSNANQAFIGRQGASSIPIQAGSFGQAFRHMAGVPNIVLACYQSSYSTRRLATSSLAALMLAQLSSGLRRRLAHSGADLRLVIQAAPRFLLSLSSNLPLSWLNYSLTFEKILELRFRPRVLIGGVDLTHRLQELTIRVSYDTGSYEAELVFTNTIQHVQNGEGLAPWDPISVYNENGPLLGAYRPVKIYLAREGSTYEELMFEGWIGPSEISDSETWGEADTLRVTCVGISQPLKDWMIEGRLALRYEQALISPSGQPDLLNRIVMDQGFAYTIHYLDDPLFHVDEYIISDVSLWEALNNALAPTGFRLIEFRDRASNTVKLAVKDPLRFKDTPDLTITGKFRARRISGAESEVRTYVGVVYRDRTDFQEKYVWAEASPEIVQLYGIPDGQGGRKHRKMVYRTAEGSLIDSESEARELAEVILWDLSTPSPDIEVEFPTILRFLEPFQLVELIGETYAVRFGIQDIEWTLSWENPYGMTRVRGAHEKIIGGKSIWFARDIKRDEARLTLGLERLQGESLATPPRFIVRGSRLVSDDGTPMPVLDVTIETLPPLSAEGVVLSWANFQLKEDRVVASYDPNERVVLVEGDGFPAEKYSSKYRDYLALVHNGELKSLGKIRTVLENAIFLESEPPIQPEAGDIVLIIRKERAKASAEYGVTRYVRLSGFSESQLVGVKAAWRRRS